MTTSRSDLRAAIEDAFDTDELDAFLSDHFAAVRADLPAGMANTSRITKLLDSSGSDGYKQLARAVEDWERKHPGRESLQRLLSTACELATAYESSSVLSSAATPARVSRPRLGAGDVADTLLTEYAKDSIDSSTLRPHGLDLLQRMEVFIRLQLQRAQDAHFVELSMQLAHGDVGSQSAHQNLGIATLVDGLGDTEPDIVTLDQLAARVRQVGGAVLLAPPGAGKTTVLHHLTLFLIGRYRRNPHDELLPVFVPLTQYRLGIGAAAPTLGISDFLKHFLSTLCGSSHFVVQRFEQLAQAGRFFFILDGLDQMAERRSETARLERLRAAERSIRRNDWLLFAVRLLRGREAESILMQRQQDIRRQAAPQIDPRESEIERISNSWPCPAITSCRLHDFVGAPDWQKIQILPLSSVQIEEFVALYAPEAREIVQLQLKQMDNTRSLISNPFYLRMLTRAFEENRRPDRSLPEEFLRALLKRGRLLAHLIRTAVQRELGSEAARADEVMTQIGEIAYFMLQHNLIGAIPGDAVKRILGQQQGIVLEIARGAGIVELREGPPLSMEFNHQLFQEMLLAFYLRKRSEEEGGFEESLTLLARRGDRWAETIKLLFEMVVHEKEWNDLAEKCTNALRSVRTWDIATRVLSELGPRIGPMLNRALDGEDELSRRGAVAILGRIGAPEFVGRLVDFHRDSSRSVRRVAVEGLTKMGKIDRLVAFEEDDDPLVLRAVYRARMLDSSRDVAAYVASVFRDPRPLHREQGAQALRDVFGKLVQRLGPDEVLGIVSGMFDSNDGRVKTIGYLIALEAPYHIRRRLKQKLLKAAIEDDDSTINYLARSALIDTLDGRDLKELRLQAAPLSKALVPYQNASSGVRARWLLMDVEERSSVRGFLETVKGAGDDELRVLTQRLANRGDAVALGLLTYLMENAQTQNHACFALASLGPLGMRHILAALDDPVPKVRLAVAEFLRFAHLPRQYARRVRHELVSQGAYRYSVHALPAAFGSVQQHATIAASLPPLNVLVLGTAMWLTGLVFRLKFGWAAATGFAAFRLEAIFHGGYAVYRDPDVVRQAERLAFTYSAIEPEPDYWLARGRMSRALGKLDEARSALERCLKSWPKFTLARYELALVNRALKDLLSAREVLTADDGRYLDSGSDLMRLDALLVLESGGEQKMHEQAQERLALLVDVRLWDEGLELALDLIGRGLESQASYYALYVCYAAKGLTARALAAGLECNLRAGSRLVPGIDLDNLRWLHRLDQFPVDVYGRFEVALDLHRDTTALALLQEHNLLPLEQEPISDQHLDKIYDLPPSVRDELIEFLNRVAPKRALELNEMLSVKGTPRLDVAP